jgi:molybdopterin converting factor subunit 1
VRVVLFGRAADQAGEREFELEVPEAATMGAVAERLVARFPQLDWLVRVSRPALNLEYTSWDQPAAEGDEISFIPPVSGG